MRAYFLYIHPPPNKFLLRFKFSSLRISRLFSFLLVSEVKFHKTNIKKISMVSIYRLRPVYTFLYTIINGNVIVSFVQKKKSIEILWSKKILGGYVRNLETTPLTCTQSYACGLTPPLPLCAYVPCGWPLSPLSKTLIKTHTCTYFSRVFWNHWGQLSSRLLLNSPFNPHSTHNQKQVLTHFRLMFHLFTPLKTPENLGVLWRFQGV